MVTGGAGYVGSHVCKALACAGFLPVTYDNLCTGNRWAVRWGPLEVGDVLDTVRLHEAVRNHRIAAVMHLAASALVGESIRNPALYYRNNATGTITLLDAMRLHKIDLIIFASTCAIYGTPRTQTIGENTRPHPVNSYGRSKLFAEQMLADCAAAYKLRYATLRYFNAAGADPDGEIGESRTVETHLIPLTMLAITGRRPPLEVLGSDYSTPDGTAVRDYVHVTDLAAAHVAALSRLLAGAESLSCNLGLGEGYSVRQIITLAEGITR